MGLQYPKINPAEGVIFREQFINPQYVADNDVTLIGSPTISSGQATFNGTTDAFNIDKLYRKSSIGSSSVGTIIARLRTSDITQTQEIVSFGDTSADTRIQFDIDSNGILRALVGVGGTTQWALDTDSVVFVNNTWIHVALVQDGTEPVLYVNGSAVAQTFSTSTDKTVWFNDMSGLDNGRVGCGNWNAGGNATFFVGDMRGVDIYDRALTAGEISDIFQEQMFSEVRVDQLEFFLRLQTHYNDGANELTPNVGVIGDDVIRWGDGSTSTTYPTLIDNNGASFDGGDYVFVNEALALSNADPFCLGCMFRLTSTGTIFIMDCREAGDEGFGIAFVAGKVRAFTDAGGAGNWAQTNLTYNDGLWHSCLANYVPNGGNTDTEIYVDGELVDSDTINQFTSATGAKPVLGASYTFASGYVGDMKYPLFWRINVNATQAKWLHNKFMRLINA